jgi:hypothetical protein
MAEDTNDDGRGDGSLVLDNPSGPKDSTSFEDAMEEEVEIIEQEQKILAKIICVPGAKTFIVDIMKKMFSIIKDIDNEATITAASGMVIKSTKDFPKGKKFSEAFNPVQSYDTKTVKMVFKLNTSTPFQTIKRRHTRLLDFLREKNMYMDESFSGSDNEELIGYCLGYQADKVHLTGLTEDLKELLSMIKLQEGEAKLGIEAGKKLPWNGSSNFPPFHVRVRNITRNHLKEEYASKAIGIIVAEEHATMARTILTRATNDGLLPGLGRYYNVVPNDRLFYRVIKWQNDTIDKTAILPILGVTRQAMLQPLDASRRDSGDKVVTCLREELSKSNYFASIHSTKATHDEGRWILIVSDKEKVKDAAKFFDTLVKSIYTSTNSQIPVDARINVYPVPQIEGKAETIARSVQPISGQQANAWGSVFSNDKETKGGSRMRNIPSRKQRQVRKVVELSFDPESKAEFPHLQTADHKDNNKNTKSVTSAKAKSTTSSHSSVSGVTKADFENLGDELRKMLRAETQSINTSGTDLTMITLMKEEMVANRKEANEQMKLMQTQMAMFQTTLTTMMPPQPTMNPNNDSESQQSESHLSESHSAETEVTHATNHENNNRAGQDKPTKNLTRTPPANLSTQPDPKSQQPSENELMHEQLTHQKPVSTGATPPSKKSRSAEKLRLESRQLDNDFEEVQTIQSTSSQSADSGEY